MSLQLPFRIRDIGQVLSAETASFLGSRLGTNGLFALSWDICPDDDEFDFFEDSAPTLWSMTEDDLSILPFFRADADLQDRAGAAAIRTRWDPMANTFMTDLVADIGRDTDISMWHVLFLDGGVLALPSNPAFQVPTLLPAPGRASLEQITRTCANIFRLYPDPDLSAHRRLRLIDTTARALGLLCAPILDQYAARHPGIGTTRFHPLSPSDSPERTLDG